MTAITHTCRQCQQPFVIGDDDQKMLDMFQAPLPTLCPEHRAQRRLAFRNERQFYRSKCAATGKEIISLYAPDSGYIVYDKDYWHGDGWNPQSFGRDYDPSRSFFEQFDELMKVVPHQNLIGADNENSNFINLAANCKDCYLLVESSNNERCLYGYWLQQCTDCVDCSFTYESELCYELDNCGKCYNLRHSWDSTNCADSIFLRGCRNVKNSIGCVGMQNAEFCIMNEQLTREEFEKRRGTLDMAAVERFVTEHPMNYNRNINAENSTGDYLFNVKDCYECTDAHEAENCRYAEHVWRDAKDIMDVSTAGRNAQLIYEGLNCALDAYDIQYSIQGWNSKSLRYCVECSNSEELFGCVSMKRAKYCILNKQYTPEEYAELKARIIANMKARGEYGEFFPASISPYGYNETSAQDLYPLTKEQAITLGFRWRDNPGQQYGGPTADRRPIQAYTDIAVAQELLGGILKCAVSGRPYKVIPQELAFLIKQGIELPQLSSDERLRKRLRRRMTSLSA